MTDQDRAIIKQLYRCTIGDDSSHVTMQQRELLKNFSVDLLKNPNELIRLLETAYEEKNSSDVEGVMFIGFVLDAYNHEYIDILCKLSLADWHIKHEDIASLFQMLRAPETVEHVYQLALSRFPCDYYYFYQTLPIKCTWALRDIGTPEAVEKLRLLAQHDNEIIRTEFVLPLIELVRQLSSIPKPQFA